jgi:alkanesulfonate monooxygenase SsuD/methylene tetrahydromethanopterin reductase-like flavin-dependent oxidoreductase (luciferase family)
MVGRYWEIWGEGRARRDVSFLGEDPLVGSTRHIVVADTDAEALALARRAFRAYAEHVHATDPRVDRASSGNPGLPAPGGANFEILREGGHLLAGSVLSVREALSRFVAATRSKHNHLWGAFQWGDLTTPEARRSLEPFVRETKPVLG